MADAGTPKKKKKKHHPTLDWLLYVAVRVLVVFLYLFDVETNLRFACFLGRLLWRHYHRGRQRALDNLRASYPDKSEEWIEQTGRRSFEQLVMLTIDILFTPRLVKRYNLWDYADLKNVMPILERMRERKGMLLVTGHYGNFEIVGYLLGLFGFEIYSIARPLDNKYLNRFLYEVRERRGQRIIDKKGAAQVMPELVKKGGTLGFIADQDAGKKGVFVDFFGRKASTYKSIGLMAITYNLPIVVGYSRRVGNRFFFEIGATRVIEPHEWANQEDPLTWITAEYAKAIETFVREDPTQYWWLHRRWKTRPKDEREQIKKGAGPSACPVPGQPEAVAPTQSPAS
jgi:Kdo2-lipid IVA lauroyltransferase/acyltransferase